MSERACKSVGIDLGTTYSALAYMDAQMTPRVISDSSGQAVMPSVIYFDDDEIIVGDMALQQAKIDANRVVQFVKLHMGDEWRRDYGGHVHTPESLSAIILGQLMLEAEPQIGPISSAVITVPAYFTEKRRRATQQAGEIAGLDVLGTLNEPMAATLSYGMNQSGEDQIAVVYDLGGGTFDVTIVHVSPTELRELATNGNRQLGGRDWDQCLIEHVAQKFELEHGVDPRSDPQVIQDLQIECERAKRRLGRLAKAQIRIHAAGRDFALEVTRDQFESTTAHLLQSTKLTTELALEDAGLTWSDVTRVVLVGGSTHMPAVRNMLKKVSGKAPDTGVNPVLAVALGAATYAHMMETGQGLKTVHLDTVAPEPVDAEAQPQAPEAEPQQRAAVSAPAVRFVTAHGVGIRTHSRGSARNTVLIPKNTLVPTSITKRFVTKPKHPGPDSGSDLTSIRIRITQGDTTDVDLAEPLGVGKITGIPRDAAAGQPVDVTMEFDSEGRLHTHASYVKTGQAMKMSLSIPGGLQQEEVDEQRKYLEEKGFLKSDLIEPIEALENSDDDLDDDDDIPILDPIE